MFKALFSEDTSAALGVSVQSVTVRHAKEGAHLVVVKFRDEAGRPWVVYGESENVDTAVRRALDGLPQKGRWRQDRLDEAGGRF